MIKSEKRDLIVAQALQEIEFARNFKQGKVKNWQINENLYYGRKLPGIEARANVDLGLMQEFINTLLSKIDNPLMFTFTKRKKSQLERVKLLNALRAIDQQKDYWDIKDLVGKKQALLYGRAIYSYHAESVDGYKACLENVDVYDFLIDPSAGGIDIERASYMGRYGVIKTKSQLQDGIKAKMYDKWPTQTLIDGSSNATESSQEQTNKMNRTVDQNVWKSQKEITNSENFKFWEWYTTYEGDRYYLLLTEKGATAIRVEPLTDLFPATKKHPFGAYPFWTWAAFPDLTEFWTPSYADYVREIFMAQAVSINQMLDNAEQINKPMKVVNVGAIENLAELKYRRDGYIKTKGDYDASRALQVIQTPSISTPIQVYELLDGIQEKASGVTAGAKGVSDEDKVGIYEGNQANTADRFGLLNKSYSFGYHRFADLYQCEVKENLKKKIAIEILGPDGIEVKEASARDIFYKEDDYAVMVEASNAEEMASEIDKRNKIQFLSAQVNNPTVNPQKLFEMQANIAGFTPEEIKSLMDKDTYGNAKIEAEASRDIEYLLDGKAIAPNKNANIAYKQIFVDYLKDQEENMEQRQFMMLVDYITSLEPVIMANTARQLTLEQNQMIKNQMANPNGAPPEAAPAGAPAGGELPVSPAII